MDSWCEHGRRGHGRAVRHDEFKVDETDDLSRSERGHQGALELRQRHEKDDEQQAEIEQHDQPVQADPQKAFGRVLEGALPDQGQGSCGQDHRSSDHDQASGALVPKQQQGNCRQEREHHGRENQDVHIHLTLGCVESISSPRCA